MDKYLWRCNFRWKCDDAQLVRPAYYMYYVYLFLLMFRLLLPELSLLRYWMPKFEWIMKEWAYPKVHCVFRHWRRENSGLRIFARICLHIWLFKVHVTRMCMWMAHFYLYTADIEISRYFRLHLSMCFRLGFALHRLPLRCLRVT